MIHHRTAKEVKRFDLFKLITVIAFLLLLILLWPFRPDSMRQSAAEEVPAEQAATEADQAAAEPAVEEESDSQAADEAAADDDAEAAIASPTLNALPTEAAAGETITLSGTGQPDSEVDLLVNGESVGTAPVDSQGNWAYDLPLTAPGDYDISVQAVDVSGQVVGAAEPLALTVAAPAPDPPTVDLPDFAALAPGDEATISGTAAPDSEVEVVVDGDVVGTAPVDSDGAWNFTLPEFTPGRYDLGLRNIDSDGNLIAEAEPTSFKWPDLSLPSVSLPSFEWPGFGRVTTAEDGTISGTAEPGTEVEVVVDGDVVGTAPVDEEGNWSFIWPEFRPGQYDLGLRNIDSDGNVVAEAEPTSFEWPDLSVSGAEAGPVAPTLDLVGGLTLPGGDIALSGTGEPDSEVEIVVDGDSLDTAPVDSQGIWTYNLPLTTPGDYEIRVQTVDESGQTLAESEVVTVTIVESEETTVPADTTDDSTAATEEAETESEATTPAASGDLTIIFPADGADILVGELTVTGSGPSGEGVEVLDDDVVLGTTQVESDNEWHYTFDVERGSLALAARLVGSQTVPTDTVAVRVVEASEPYDCSTNPGLDRGDTYLVGTCDTLGTIARQVGTAFNDLVAANQQLEDIDLIYPGEVLNIPGGN